MKNSRAKNQSHDSRLAFITRNVLISAALIFAVLGVFNLRKSINAELDRATHFKAQQSLDALRAATEVLDLAELQEFVSALSVRNRIEFIALASDKMRRIVVASDTKIIDQPVVNLPDKLAAKVLWRTFELNSPLQPVESKGAGLYYLSTRFSLTGAGDRNSEFPAVALVAMSVSSFQTSLLEQAYSLGLMLAIGILSAALLALNFAEKTLPKGRRIVIDPMKKNRQSLAKTTTITAPSLNAQVLLVESAAIAGSARQALEKLGLKVSAVETDEQAVELFNQQKNSNGFDLILLNCSLPWPWSGGVAMTSAIRDWEKESGKHIPIVALSEKSEAGEAARYKAAGMDDVLPKPLDPEKVNEIIRKWSGESAAAK